ncbi:MAG: hypothetical protein JNK58_06220 [Phycisphaerae bacterium]|nr:hypothetical protein [Phycisphaerae bacterium]
MNHTPKIILRLLFVIALFCVVTAVGGIVIAARGQAWYALAFEVVVLVTALPCVRIGAGRAGSGHAMGMLCLGGVVGVTAALIDPDLIKSLIQRQTPRVQPIGGVNVMPWILARLALGGVLIGMAALTVLLRRPARSFPLLLKGMAFGLPVLMGAAAFLIPSLRGKLTGLAPIWLIVLAIAGTALLCVLVSASGHLILRAFQVGIEEEGDGVKR